MVAKIWVSEPLCLACSSPRMGQEKWWTEDDDDDDDDGDGDGDDDDEDDEEEPLSQKLVFILAVNPIHVPTEKK